MRKFMTLAASAALLTASSVHAGGMADEVMEAPVIVEEPMMEPAGSSVSPTLIVVGLLAALLLAANLGEEEDEIPPETSDMRLKENIVHLGTGLNGLPIYSFSYIGKEGTYLGVMAQDVLMHTPDAVIVGDDGYMRVDYGMLGMRMVELN